VLRELLVQRVATPDPVVIAAAAGSAARAFELCEPERVAHREQFVSAVLAALEAPDLGAALQLAASGAHDRASLGEDLADLAQYFALEARREAAGDARRTLRSAKCHGEVQVALRSLERNTPPNLTLEALIARLRRQ
jgi:hypothetical protein